MSSLNRATGLSQNTKLGAGVATNYRPVGNAAQGKGTCPSTCKMLGNGCYAQKGLVGMQSHKSRSQYDDLAKLLSKGAQFVRLHTSGDFFIQTDCGSGYQLDVLYFLGVINLANQNPNVIFWTYCHDVSKLVEFGFDYLNGSIPSNLHITASVDTLEARDYAKSHGFRTARVILERDDKVKGETLCPYDYAKKRGVKPSVKCVSCKLCFNHDHKNDIAFIAH